jgi:hypothetical protein
MVLGDDSSNACCSGTHRPSTSVLELLRIGQAQDMQTLAYRHILSGLKDAGLLVGDVGDMLTAEVGGVFMPHGDCHPHPARLTHKAVPTIRSRAAGVEGLD